MLCAGSAAGYWGWPLPAVLAFAAMIVVWLTSLGVAGLAAGLWFIAAAISAVVLNLATIA